MVLSYTQKLSSVVVVVPLPMITRPSAVIRAASVLLVLKMRSIKSVVPIKFVPELVPVFPRRSHPSDDETGVHIGFP